MIRLALTDLDDTLIPFGSPCASEQSRAAIHATLDAGVRFGPVTGRLPVDMRWMFGDDEPCYATGAFANGQVVRVDGRTVKEVVIPASELSRVQEVLDDVDYSDMRPVIGDPVDDPRYREFFTTRPVDRI